MPNWKKLIVSGSDAELANLKLTGLSGGTASKAVMINDSTLDLETRTLGSNAFNSTSFATGDNFDADGTFASLRAQGTTKGDVGLGNVENTALSTYTGENGALDNQYITNGANYVTAAVTLTTAAQTNITSLGTLTSLTVDDITLNGSTISDGGSLTLDIGGDLNIDVDGADIILKDGGTSFGRFKRDNSNFIIKSEAQDKDIILRGNDGGTTIDALTLDMSNGGSATFRDDIDFGGKLTQTGTGANTLAGRLDIDDTTASDAKTTGALVVDGGVGIAGALNVGGDVTAFASSDIRFKDSINPIEYPNEKIKLLSGNTFVWNDKHAIYKGKKDIGVIAQEVETVFPEIVETREDGYKAVRYEKIVALLIESNKELIKRVEDLENQL